MTAPITTTALQADWTEARRLYNLGDPRISYDGSQSPEEYVSMACHAQPPSNPRVRRYAQQLAREDWARFQAGLLTDSKVYLVERIDVLSTADGWRVIKYFSGGVPHQTEDKPADWSPLVALDWFKYERWTVHHYGPLWFRAWPGEPTPVRSAGQMHGARRKMDTGRFYIPEGFETPRSSINLLYDL